MSLIDTVAADATRKLEKSNLRLVKREIAEENGKAASKGYGAAVKAWKSGNLERSRGAVLIGREAGVKANSIQRSMATNDAKRAAILDAVGAVKRTKIGDPEFAANVFAAQRETRDENGKFENLALVSIRAACRLHGVPESEAEAILANSAAREFLR
jgi:hypothetical protein